MWSRYQLKTAARNIMSRHYWELFAAALIYTLISGGASSLGELASNIASLPAIIAGSVSPYDVDSFTPFALISGAIGIGSVIGIAVGVFLCAPLEVGCNRYFLESTQERLNFGNLFFPFTCGRYGNVVFVCFLRNLFTFLWTLLFIFPGIVKAYAYIMVPYLLSENPSLDYRRALAISEDMTRGHKWEMFVLDLSFLGWNLLGILACGIGVLFVNPYYLSTHAQLYVTLRAIALDRGIINLAELEASPE